MPAEERPQLDLFADSRDVMLRNDAIDALMRRDLQAAGAARQALSREDPQHGSLPVLDILIAALSAPGHGAFSSVTDSTQARRQVEHTLEPAVLSLLGPNAAAWLAPVWRRLAERAAALPFVAAHSDGHAATLWLLAGEPATAAQAVERIDSWRRIPQPLAWMIQARHACEGLDAVWPLLAELAWVAPSRFSVCVRALSDPLLDRLLRRFDAEFDPGADTASDPLAWFPAWLANDQPGLLPLLRQAQAGLATEPERAFRLMAELLGLERQGRHNDLIASRKRLRDLQPALYALYMRTR
jgi:hypothetical protein